jgi:hypothetical protein
MGTFDSHGRRGGGTEGAILLGYCLLFVISNFGFWICRFCGLQFWILDLPFLWLLPLVLRREEDHGDHYCIV